MRKRVYRSLHRPLLSISDGGICLRQQGLLTEVEQEFDLLIKPGWATMRVAYAVKAKMTPEKSILNTERGGFLQLEGCLFVSSGVLLMWNFLPSPSPISFLTRKVASGLHHGKHFSPLKSVIVHHSTSPRTAPRSLFASLISTICIRLVPLFAFSSLQADSGHNLSN